MTPEAVLFALIRSVICDENIQDEVKAACTPEMLEGVHTLAAKQDLAHLTGHGLSKLSLPESEPLKQMKQAAFQAVVRQVKQNYEYASVCKVLEEAQISYIPLKGTVLREYYPASWMRTSCDMDILVHEEMLDAAVEALRQKLQYTNWEKTDHDISLFSPSGVHVELHYDTIQERYAVDGCRDVLAQIWDTAVPAETGAHHFLLTDEMFYFYHIAHMVKHFEVGGCGIRPFLDLWIMNHKIEYDRKKREQLLQEGGLLQFALAAERVAEFWFSGAEPEQMDRAISDYILRAGLYGDNANRAALGQAKSGGRWKYLLTQRIFMPYDYLKAEYPILKDHKFLLPVYQVVRWGRMLFSGRLKATVKELKANIETGDKATVSTTEILKHLGL